MKIEGYAKEIADFFALGYYSEAYFKVEIERVPDVYNNGNATVAVKFPSDPPKRGEDCRPFNLPADLEQKLRHWLANEDKLERLKARGYKTICVKGSPLGWEIIDDEENLPKAP